MAIKIYNPTTKNFVSFTPGNTELPFVEVLLLNILIEMQVHSVYLSETTNLDEPSTVRSDLVAEI